MGFVSFQHRHPVVAAIAGVAIVLMGIIVALTGPSLIITYAKNRQLALRPSSTSFDKWSNSEIKLKAYIFNITNPADVHKNGSKPIVEEIGPFVYTAKQRKVDIKFRSEEEVEYRKTYKVYFERDLSVGDESMEVTVLNAEMAAFLWKYRKEPPSLLAKSAVVVAMKREKYRGVFVKRTIKQLLHGHKGKLARSTFQSRTAAFLVPLNNSVYPISVIGTGRTDFGQLNHLMGYDGHDHFPQWSDPRCSKIPDDLRAEPNIGPDTPDDVTGVKLFLFWSRAMEFLLKEKRIPHKAHGYELEVNRFTSDPRFYDNGFDDPHHRCYDSDMISPDGYTKPKRKSNESSGSGEEEEETSTTGWETGFPSGVFDLSSIKEAPVLMSYPHFIHADPYFQQSIIGLKPDPSIHLSEWLIQPDTGVMAKFKNQFQINLALQPNHRKIGLGFDAAPAIVYPMLWMEHETYLPESAAKKIHMATRTVYPVCHILAFLISCGGLLLLFLAVRSMLKSRRKGNIADPINKYPSVKPQILQKANETKVNQISDIPGPETDL